MRREVAADKHSQQFAVLRQYGGVRAQAIVFAFPGSRWWVFLRGFIGPLKIKCAYLAAVAGKFQVWVFPGPKGADAGLVAAHDRPVVLLSTGRWFDRVSVGLRSFVVPAWQRPYLRELLECAATPPIHAVRGLPAGWHRDPWSFPGEASRSRFWDGQQWTGHVSPEPDDPPNP